MADKKDIKKKNWLIGGMIGYALSSASYGLLLGTLKEKELAHKERI